MARLAIAAVLAAVASCSPRSRRTPDDTLVVLIEAPMKSADPRYALTTLDLKLSKLVVPGLVAVDTPDLAPRMELAESVVRVDDLTWDVTLRPGLRFSDGTPVTAADVAWTFGTVIADGSDSFAHKQLSERFSRIEVRDDRTARFHLHGKLATFITDLDFGILARHAAGPDGRFPATGLIGAGPYRLVALDSDRVLLAANRHYHGQVPRLPRVDIRVVRDASARILMLVGGSADLAQNVVRLDLVDDVQRRPRVKIEAAPSAILSYLLINNADPLLSDVRVRRAIALAIDRPQIIAAKLGGRAVAATGLLPTTHWAYTDDVERWDHDPDAARRLLDEAGLRDPDGPGPLPRLRLTYKTSTDLFRVTIARILAAQLGEVGIEVDVRAFEFATFFADIKKGTYQLASMQSTDLTEPDYYFTFFHSSRIPTPGNPDAGNRWFYRSPRIDELTERGRRELDPARRLALYVEAQQIVARDVPIVPLWHDHVVVVANRDVDGYAITPNARLTGLATATKRRQ